MSELTPSRAIGILVGGITTMQTDCPNLFWYFPSGLWSPLWKSGFSGLR